MAIIATKEELNGRGIIPAINFGHMAAPRIHSRAEYPIVSHSPQELGELYTMKMKNKKARIKAYGKDANKHLNIPSKTVGVMFHGSF